MKTKTKIILFLLGVIFFAGIMHHAYVKSRDASENLRIADSLRIVVGVSNARYDSLKVLKRQSDSTLLARINGVNNAKVNFKSSPKLKTETVVDMYLKQFIEE